MPANPVENMDRVLYILVIDRSQIFDLTLFFSATYIKKCEDRLN